MFISRSRLAWRLPRSSTDGAGLLPRRQEQLLDAQRRRRINYKFLATDSVLPPRCEQRVKEDGQLLRCWPTVRCSAGRAAS